MDVYKLLRESHFARQYGIRLFLNRSVLHSNRGYFLGSLKLYLCVIGLGRKLVSLLSPLKMV